ncbi:MAG: nuclear transport factor 2 family protein [Pyrinomonadaceae bacterium]
MSENKEIIEKVNTSFEQKQLETFLDLCTDDVIWQMAGMEDQKGKDSIRKFMASMGEGDPPKINVTAIISDGDRAACYGDMTMKEKGEENAYDYCDIYKFTDGKIAELRSFFAKHQAEGEAEKAAA